MAIKHGILFLTATSLIAQPVLAEDDPNAALKAQAATYEAEAAKANAEAAKIKAQSDRDKAAIDGLGLPHFDNKTSLENDGGAIETAMLATRAISRAATLISGQVGCGREGQAQTVVVLAGHEKLDLNSGKVMSARLDNFAKRFAALLPAEPARPYYEMSPTMVISAASAVAGLLGSETTVSGVKLPEIDDQMLAEAVAGQLKGCAVLPSAGAGIIDDRDPLRLKLNDVIAQRNRAAVFVANRTKKSKAGQIAALTAAVTDFDAFLKEIGTANADGSVPFVSASLAERLTLMPRLKLLRVTVNRSGGTVTNSKNIATYVGADPIRVSGGMVASYALVDARTGMAEGGDTIACQTARVKLRDVQSGNWSGDGSKSNQGKAFCKSSLD